MGMEPIARAAMSREEWRKRVERWKSSGLTAKEFAAEVDVNVGTLYHWGWKLKSWERLSRRPTVRQPNVILASLVEVAAPAVTVESRRLEVELRNGRRVWVAAGVDPEELRKLLAALEAA